MTFWWQIIGDDITFVVLFSLLIGILNVHIALLYELIFNLLELFHALGYHILSMSIPYVSNILEFLEILVIDSRYGQMYKK